LPRAGSSAVLHASLSSNLRDELIRMPAAPIRVPVDDAGVLRDVDVPEDLTRPSR
jgi:hypothetical protein